MTRTILSTPAIADMLDRSQRTVERYIAQGKLPAIHRGGNRYEVDTADIDALRVQSPLERRSELEAIISRIEAIEHRLEALMTILEALEQRVLSLESPRHTMPAPSHPRPVATHIAPADIPPGSVRSHEFAAAHGVNQHTFRDQIRKGIRGERVEVIVRDVPNRPREHEYWLTPEQQAACVDFWRRHGTPHG